MNDKLDVLGVEIDTLEAVDAFEKTAEFLSTEALHTAVILTVGMLLEAGRDEAYKAVIEQLDLGVIGEKEILAAAGLDKPERITETEQNWYLMSLLEYAGAHSMGVFLLSEDERGKAAAVSFLEKRFPELKIVGTAVCDEDNRDSDNLINLINGASPEIILAALGVPEQEWFIHDNKTKLNARLWLGVGKMLGTHRASELKTGFLGKMIENRIFKKKMVKYQQEKGDLQ